RARDDDERSARLLADHSLRKALLAWALNEHCGVIADAAIEERPFDAVGHGSDQSRQFRCNALRHAMHDCVPWKVHVLCEAAPQVRRPLGRCVTITDGVRVVTPVRAFAMA